MTDNYAEDVNYWKTSSSSIETWQERVEKEIENIDGEILSSAFGKDVSSGQSAFMYEFEIGADRFKIVWPVLKTYAGDRAAEKAAKRQAITALYHDVKATCVKAKFLGTRTAFFNNLVLPDGRTTAQASFPELMDGVPAMLNQTALPPQVEGEVFEADFTEN